MFQYVLGAQSIKIQHKCDKCGAVEETHEAQKLYDEIIKLRNALDRMDDEADRLQTQMHLLQNRLTERNDALRT